MINKEDSSPSLRCVRCPKVETFVLMFRAKLAAGKASGRSFGYLGPLFFWTKPKNIYGSIFPNS